MNFEVIVTEPFERKLKKLAKKHKSFKADLGHIFNQLAKEPTLGTSIGKDCYKIRMAITSKGKGKSGGARMITYVRVIKTGSFCLIFMTSPISPIFPIKNSSY